MSKKQVIRMALVITSSSYEVVDRVANHVHDLISVKIMNRHSFSKLPPFPDLDTGV